MRNIFVFLAALLLVKGVFGDDHVTVSVMEGDSVTLKPHTEIPEDDSAQWWFGDKLIAKINKADGIFSTYDGVPDGRFNGRLNLDHQTGSLTITNTRTDHTGLYKLKIKSSKEISKIFNVTVTGNMTTVSVKEGGSVTLDTGVIEIKGSDLIMWKFEDHLIAEINKGTNGLIHDSSDERFKGRLQLHPQTGSLTISDSRITDSGDYHLNMNSSTHTLKRTISVSVSGVFGVDETVSVMEGDSVTLKPHTVIPEDDSAQWWFGSKIIANINRAAGRFSTSEGDDGIFKDRLNLDHQTGSLTITNSRTDHTGLYKLKIKSRTETFKTFNVAVRGGDVVESVSVTEGDSVTLQTGVTDIQRDDQILWKFGGVLIADLNGPGDTRWRNIHRNNENGDLTIRNIRTDQSGDYELEINTTSMILHRKLHITISDEMTTVSVKEGEYITLDTGVIEIQGYDLIMWKFEDHLIAEINKGTNGFLTHDSSDERFNGRLKMHPQIISLIISDSRITDSGDYHLNMISTSHIVQRTISVTVSDSDMSAGAIAGIVVGVLLVFAAAAVAGVIYRRWKISKLKRAKDVAGTNGTNDPLKEQTANSDDL